MAKSGIKHIDVGLELTKTEWESEGSHELIHGNSFPSSPDERQLFYRDDEHKWYIYNGSAWVDLQGTGGGVMDKSCRVHHSADQTLPTGTVVFSAFDTEVWDTDDIHDIETNNTRLTCKTAGKYMIAGGGQFVANATGRRHAQIKLNGTTVIAGQHFQAVTDSGGVTSLTIGTIYNLAVNDYVELGFYQASGGDLDLQGGQVYSPWFSMARIA